jgi:hypothetical protein
VIYLHNKISSSPSTLWLSLLLVDRYICEKNVDVSLLQLIAVSSLLLASGVHDSNPITARTCRYETKGIFSLSEIEEFSNKLSFGLPIDTTVVTAIQEIDAYLQTLSAHPRVLSALQKYEISLDLIRYLAYFHAERNLFDPNIAWQRPNLFAISSLKTAFLCAFLNPNPNTSPSVRSPSNSVDSAVEGILLASSSLDENDEDYFIPLQDPYPYRSASNSDASATSGGEQLNSDPKRRCVDEMIQLLSEISGESLDNIQEISLFIAKNVNSDFYLTLHPSSPLVFEPNTFMSPLSCAAQGRAKRMSASPGPSPRHIVIPHRSFSDTHIPSYEPQGKAKTTPTAATTPTTPTATPTPTPTLPPITIPSMNPTGTRTRTGTGTGTETPSRTRSVSHGIYGLGACRSTLRDKYSQPRYHRVADMVVPLFD